MEEGESYKDLMLQSIRERNEYERRIKRENVFNKKRGFLGEVFNKPGVTIKPQEVILLANHLKIKGRANEAGIIKLTRAFIQNEENINLFLNNSGALHALVRELTGTNSLTRLAAAECCVNLSLGNGKCCFKLAKSVSPYLITNLQTMCLDLQTTSIWALGNLSGSDLRTWNLLNSQGVLPLLLELISVTDLQDIVVYTLLHYVNTGFNNMQTVEFTTIASSLLQLKNYTPDSMWLLYLLSCSDCYDVDMSLRFIETCLIALNKCLEYNTMIMTAVIRILANSVVEMSGRCAEYVIVHLCEIFRKIINSSDSEITSPSHSHLVSEFCWLIGNLLNHASSVVQQRIQLFDEKANELQLLFRTVKGIYG